MPIRVRLTLFASPAFRQEGDVDKREEVRALRDGVGAEVFVAPLPVALAAGAPAQPEGHRGDPVLHLELGAVRLHGVGVERSPSTGRDILVAEAPRRGAGRCRRMRALRGEGVTPQPSRVPHRPLRHEAGLKVRGPGLRVTGTEADRDGARRPGTTAPGLRADSARLALRVS